MSSPSKYCRAKKKKFETSLVVQLLRLCPSNAEGMGSIPSQGTEIPHAAWHSQKAKRTEEGTEFIHKAAGQIAQRWEG